MKPARPSSHAIARGILALPATILVLGLLGGTPRAANEPGEPIAVVKATVDEALKVLRDHDTPLEERQQKLRQIVKGRFDFTAMARSALGYHWRKLSPEQRADFTRTFVAFIEDAYLSRINEYSGQTVDYVKQSYRDGGYAQVDTRLNRKNKRPVPITYRMRKIDGKWMVYDVTVDAISITANYRNQFNRVINREGYEVLIERLRKKESRLSASLGTRRAHGARKAAAARTTRASGDSHDPRAARVSGETHDSGGAPGSSAAGNSGATQDSRTGEESHWYSWMPGF